MKRETFDKAYVCLDQIAKLKQIKEKIKQQFPEFEYDKLSKEIGDDIFDVLNHKIELANKRFDEL